MNDFYRLKIEDLQKLCDEHEEETLTLEFKACSELKIGTEFRDKSGQTQTRERDDVLNELTKDVSAFLNSAGGTIIYGILENNSRANRIDENNSFKLGSKQDNIRPEKIVDWLRAHIQPPPSIDVYRVLETEDETSPWYLVIEIPQGQHAYMARNHRFYKRVSNTAQLMEQYEVNDVMNRTRAAALELQIRIRHQSQPKLPNERVALSLDIRITSTNFIASEYGALKLTAAYPTRLDETPIRLAFSSSRFEPTTRLILDGETNPPNAQSLMIPWGANTGNIIFPGDWYNFHGNPITLKVPNSSTLPNSTYLIQTELFTMNSQSKRMLYAIRHWPLSSNEENFEGFRVENSTYANVLTSFWDTYHLARKKFVNQSTG